MIGEILLVLAAAASVVTVVKGAAGLRAWLRERAASNPRPRPQEFELIPIRFEVSVGPGNVPSIVVTLKAINYLRRSLSLNTIRVRYLHIGSAPILSEIGSLDDYDIPGQCSREVYCRRNLQDSEAEPFRSGTADPGDQGSAMLSARGVWSKGLRRRELRYEPGVNWVIFGVVKGLPRKT